MPWFSDYEQTPPVQSLTWGSPQSFSLDENSVEIVPAGTSSRVMSISISPNSAPVYICYGSAVNVSTKNYNNILPKAFEHNQMEISAQPVYAATQGASLAAEIIVAVAS